MTRLSITKAAQEWGISRNRIAAAVRTGKLLSATGRNNAKTVDPADLLRVFGEPTKQLGAAPSSNMEQLSEQLVERLKSEIQFLRDQLDREQTRNDNLQKELRDIRKPILPRLLPWMKD